MRKLIAIGVVVGLCGTGLVARTTIINYFAEYFDDELPPPPCQTFYPPSTFSHGGFIFFVYTCTDGRTLKRTFTVASRGPQFESPTETLVACPASGHRACSCLPEGSYSSTWMDTVGCGR